MHKLIRPSQSTTPIIEPPLNPIWMRGFAWVLILMAGLHSWPFGATENLRLFWPANLVLFVWVGVMCTLLVRSPQAWIWLKTTLPPTPVWAYLIVCAMSVASSDHITRTGIAVGKVFLAYTIGFSLYMAVIRNMRTATEFLFPLLLIILVELGLAFVQRLSSMPATGFFEYPLKLGTFLAMTVPVCLACLLNDGRYSQVRLACAIAIASASTYLCESWLAIIGLLIAMAFIYILTPQKRLKCLLTLASGIVMAMYSFGAASSPLRDDVRLRESQTSDIRQRYLEWQAQLNLLVDRGAMGTGLGNLNEYRSEYYLQLPKNNTIVPFDQNGWLAGASEIGVMGLVCLSWMFLRGIRLGIIRKADIRARAGAVGLIGAAIASLESSAAYAGVVIIFVLLLALVESIEDHGNA